MATGTGKTFLTVAQIYQLLESKLAKRILFLVDCTALPEQLEIVRRVEGLFALADPLEVCLAKARGQVVEHTNV